MGMRQTDGQTDERKVGQTVASLNAPDCIKLEISHLRCDSNARNNTKHS